MLPTMGRNTHVLILPLAFLFMCRGRCRTVAYEIGVKQQPRGIDSNEIHMVRFFVTHMISLESMPCGIVAKRDWEK